MILVIDDAEEIREFMVTALQEEGYEAVGCSALAGLGYALTAPPALIFLDILMPDISGPQIAEELSRHPETRSIPIVIITAWTDTGCWFERHQPYAILQKPFGLRQFISIAASVVGPAQKA